MAVAVSPLTRHPSPTSRPDLAMAARGGQGARQRPTHVPSARCCAAAPAIHGPEKHRRWNNGTSRVRIFSWSCAATPTIHGPEKHRRWNDGTSRVRIFSWSCAAAPAIHGPEKLFSRRMSPPRNAARRRRILQRGGGFCIAAAAGFNLIHARAAPVFGRPRHGPASLPPPPTPLISPFSCPARERRRVLSRVLPACAAALAPSVYLRFATLLLACVFDSLVRVAAQTWRRTRFATLLAYVPWSVLLRRLGACAV